MATAIPHADSARIACVRVNGDHADYSWVQRRQTKEGGYVILNLHLSLFICLQIEKLRNTLSYKKNLLEFRRSIRLPLDPVVKVTGIVAENASMFKSALTPAKLCFKTTSNNIYWVSAQPQVRLGLGMTLYLLIGDVQGWG